MSENVPIRIFGLGTVEARVLSKVGFEVGAAITELNADHGDIVKEGTVLARLHATQQDAKVARAKAVLLSNEAAIKKAEVNLTKDSCHPRSKAHSKPAQAATGREPRDHPRS